MELYPENLTQKLGFDEIKALIANRCESQQARSIAHNTTATDNLLVIRYQLGLTEELKWMKENRISAPGPPFNLIELDWEALKVRGFAETLENLYAIYYLVRDFTQLQKLMVKNKANMPLWSAEFTAMADLSYLFKPFEKVFDEEGRVKDSATQLLHKLRKSIKAKEKEVESTFDSLVIEARKNELLSEETESFRLGERVLAVQRKYKKRIKGIILGESGSGKTFFILPESIVNLRNELTELNYAETRELNKIRAELTILIQPHVDNFPAITLLLAKYEFTQAKARLADEYGWNIPVIKDEGETNIMMACHPILQVRHAQTQTKTVPFDLQLDPDTRILVVSGPNAGGKSVFLKAAGLLQLMLQSGIPVPADPASVFGVFTKIFVDIGDDQDLREDLSTYSSHLLHYNYFIRNANEKTFFFIDEFGSGTDPRIGGAIAEVILDELRMKKCQGIVTTHYSNLKIFAQQAPGLGNATMEFDERQLKPTFRLLQGQFGNSYAFELLKNAGYQKKVLDKIGRKTSKGIGNLEKLYEELLAEKQEIERKTNDIRAKKKELDNLIALQKEIRKSRSEILREEKITAARKADTYLENINRRFEKLMKELAEAKGKENAVVRKKIRDQLTSERKKVNERLEKKQSREKKNRQINVHDWVGHVTNKGLSGEVVQIKGQSAVVVVNGKRTVISLKDLVKKEKDSKQGGSSVKLILKEEHKDFFPVLDVRGFRKEETIEALHQFIDSALINKIKLMRIIHGHGDGILKKVVRDVLSGYDRVENIRFENSDRGGEGVTVFEIR